MIKKRSRPPPKQRQRSLERDDEPPSDEELQEGDEKLEYAAPFHQPLLILTEGLNSLTDLIELRKLRRQRQGIDSTKLTKGDAKKKKKRQREDEVEQGGLKKGAEPEDECVCFAGSPCSVAENPPQ